MLFHQLQISSLRFLLQSSIVVIVVACCLVGHQVSAAENQTRLREAIFNLDDCMIQSVYSFLYKDSYPPRSTEDLRNTCKRQLDGFKCLKERGKTAGALLRRSLVTFVQTRQRYHKKYCTSPNSEVSQTMVKNFKCIMDKRLAEYQALDTNLANSLLELKRRNYNDSATELKYLCCTLVTYRRSFGELAGAECAASKAHAAEMVASVVTDDTNLICEDDEKLLTKVCPKLEPIKVSKTYATPKLGDGPSSTTLYLIATLGESETGISKR